MQPRDKISTLKIYNIEMAKIVVEHEKYGKVLLDTETQTYEYCENKSTITFIYKNKSLPYFDSVLDAINSGINMMVVPMVCTESKAHKRRTYVELVDINNYSYNFYNVEMIDSRWVHNKIENIKKGFCFFILLIIDSKSMNDCRVISSMQINKNKV